MKTNDNGNHKIGSVGAGTGVTSNDPAAATGFNPLDAEFVDFDAQGADAPATEAASNKKKNRRRRIITGVILMLLLAAGVAVLIYFMLGGNRTPLSLKVRDTRVQDSKTQAKPQNPDDVTSQAIAEVRSATPEANPTVPPTPKVMTEGTRTSTATPVTVPIEGLGGTVTQPAPNTTGATSEQPVKETTSANTDTTGTTGANNTSTSIASRRNPERSIRCALPVALTTPLSNPDVARNPQRQVEKDAPSLSKQKGSGVVLPSFGSMLPVRSLGVLYTLRSGSLARFELTRDVRGQGWSMKKGTVIVGVNRGSEYDRAYMAVVGFIDPESGRLVKLTGDVLGGDGGSGMRGRRRQLSSAWSRAFTRIGASAVNVAGAVASGIGRGSVIVSDAYGYRVTNPMYF